MGSGAVNWRDAIVRDALALGAGSDMAATLQSHVTELSQSDLSNMLATPPVVLSALAGFMHHPTLVVIQYHPVTVDYTIGDATELIIAPRASLANNVLQPINATLLDGSGGPGSVVSIAPAANVAQGLTTVFAGTDLIITHNGTGELFDGDGTATVTLYYISAAC
jgi:hypothetical protein